jgi:exonuclease VII large subunit
LREPTTLRDLNSWALALASVVCGILALFDAYKLEDPYPGYGTLHRKMLRAVDDFEHQRATFRMGLESLKEDALRSLERLLSDAQVSLRNLDSAIEQKATTHQSFESCVKNIETALHAVIGRFRDENARARSSAVAQARYPDPPTIAVATLDFEVSRDRAKFAAQQGEIDNLKAKVEQIRAQIQSSFNRQLNSQLPLDSHLNPDS